MMQLIFISYLLLVSALSLMPSASIMTGFNADKVSHLLAYAGMGFLAYVSAGSKRQRVYLFTLCFFFGLSLELLQIFIPGRYATIFDIIANTLGLGIAYAASWVFFERVLKSYVSNDKVLDSFLSRGTSRDY